MKYEIRTLTQKQRKELHKKGYKTKLVGINYKTGMQYALIPVKVK